MSYSSRRQAQRRGWRDNTENEARNEASSAWRGEWRGAWGRGDAQVDQPDVQTEFRRDVNAKLDTISHDVQTLALRMQNVMTRAEIEAALDRRVSLDRYVGDMNDISGRLTRQETGWTRILPWLSLAVSIIGVGIPVLLAVIYGIIYLAQHP